MHLSYLKDERAALSMEITRLTKRLDEMPEGRLTFRKDRGGCKWFCVQDVDEKQNAGRNGRRTGSAVASSKATGMAKAVTVGKPMGTGKAFAVGKVRGVGQAGTAGKAGETADGHRSHRVYTYIPKARQDLAEQLALKAYLEQRLTELRREQEALDHYIGTIETRVSESMMSGPGFYTDLLKKADSRTFPENVQAWMEEEYERSNEFPENLIYHTLQGTAVRSKSEMLIASRLELYHVPYRYECAVMLGNREVYPDFTIMHPVTGKIYYWEHFGMMDKQKYADTARGKLDRYIANGLCPQIDFMATFETQEHPLDLKQVEKIIQTRFV